MFWIFDPFPFAMCHTKIILKILTNHLKPFIHTLVGHELNAFIVGRSSFDSIITV